MHVSIYYSAYYVYVLRVPASVTAVLAPVQSCIRKGSAGVWYDVPLTLDKPRYSC